MPEQVEREAPGTTLHQPVEQRNVSGASSPVVRDHLELGPDNLQQVTYRFGFVQGDIGYTIKVDESVGLPEGDCWGRLRDRLAAGPQGRPVP